MVSAYSMSRQTPSASTSPRPPTGPRRDAAQSRVRWLSARGAFRLAVLALMGALVTLIGLRFYTEVRYGDFALGPHDVRPAPVAIVFGAGVWLDGQPTPVLYDRVAAAADLYRLGKVETLLLSGDGRLPVLDEPAAMQRVAVQLGVPESAIVLDPEGLRTYASCERAHDVFGVSRAVLVTQTFHLPRARLLCEAHGIDTEGLASDRQRYPWRWSLSWQVRETLATAVAWGDVVLHRIGLEPPRPAAIWNR